MGFREMVISDHRNSWEMLNAYRTKVDAMSDEADRAIMKTIVVLAKPSLATASYADKSVAPVLMP